jgi:hypothetical protein
MRWRSHSAADVAKGSQTQGIDDFATADVSASAGVQETSTYRRGSRENPVVAALLDDSTTTPVLDTSSAREDLIVAERAVAERLSQPGGVPSA